MSLIEKLDSGRFCATSILGNKYFKDGSYNFNTSALDDWAGRRYQNRKSLQLTSGFSNKTNFTIC